MLIVNRDYKLVDFLYVTHSEGRVITTELRWLLNTLKGHKLASIKY